MSSQFPQYQHYLEHGDEFSGGDASGRYTNPVVGESSGSRREPGSVAASGPGRTATAGPASLGLRVSTEERDRAQGFLAEAYADGRLSEWDFDQRLEQVLTATTRRELNGAFYGLVTVPPAGRALGLHPAYRPSLVDHGPEGRFGQTAAGLAHLSGLFTWVFGPLLFHILATPGSYARRESAKAFNFQLVSGGAFLGAGILAAAIGSHAMGSLLGLLWFAWLLLTIIGGAKAFGGQDWKNPVGRAIRWQPMDEGAEKQRRR